MEWTEQTILLQAPNPAAAENGRKLSRKGSFSARCKTADGGLYWARTASRCAGAPAPAASSPASTPWG